jgi:hypothetical protein
MQRGRSPGAVHTEPRFDQEPDRPGTAQVDGLLDGPWSTPDRDRRHGRDRLPDGVHVVAESRSQEPVDVVDRGTGRPGTSCCQQRRDLGAAVWTAHSYAVRSSCVGWPLPETFGSTPLASSRATRSVRPWATAQIS